MNWEIQLLQSLQSIRNPGLTAFMEAISFMAESIFLVIIIATLYWCIDKKKTLRMAWLILFSGVTNGILKNLIRAPRPFQKGVVSPLRVETATSYSFPSGHVQSATSFWGGATLIFKNKTFLLMSIVMVLLTSLSRLYLGVHWPVDVIGGMITGVLSILVADMLYDEEKGFTNWHVIGVGVLAIILLIVPIDGDLASAVGGLWGLVVGSFIESKYVQFSVEGSWKLQLKKILSGFGGTVLIYVGWDFIFADSVVFNLIKYALVLLWISAGAPYFFKKVLMTKK